MKRSIREERDAAIAQLNQLEMERDSANTRLAEERDAAIAQLNQLEEERDAAIAEAKQLARDKAALTSTVEDLKQILAISNNVIYYPTETPLISFNYLPLYTPCNHSERIPTFFSIHPYLPHSPSLHSRRRFSGLIR